MPFGLVSAWNKRRRSKSQDHSDPCMFFLFFITLSLRFFVNLMLSHVFVFFPGVYKPVEFWQLEDQTPKTTKRHHGSSVFTLKEMEKATCSFSDDNFIGKGGFGRVYRGTLRSGEVYSKVQTIFIFNIDKRISTHTDIDIDPYNTIIVSK